MARFDDFDTQIQVDEIRDWYDYELYYGYVEGEEEEIIPEEYDDWMREVYDGAFQEKE